MDQNVKCSSLKKRIRGLMALVLAVATIVAVFPPIDAQAVADQDYYYFLTEFDNSNMKVGYFIKSDEMLYDHGSGAFEDFLGYRSGSFRVSDYYNFVSYCDQNHNINVTTLGSLSIPESNDSTVGYLSLNEDVSFEFLPINTELEDVLDVFIDGDVENYSFFWAWDNGEEFSVPAGNYRINYSYYFDDEGSGDCYVFNMDFITLTGMGPSDGNPFVAKMYQQIKDKANEIGLAAQGLNADGSVNATKTVYYTAPSVNAEIIKALMKADGVSLVVTYNFAGFEFVSTITPEKAREMYREDITWYGPAYIAKYCGATWTGKTA